MTASAAVKHARPTVSVVMSVYSRVYVRLAIDSILSQTYRDFEFILVDDSADPATAALLEQYAARDPRLVVHHNERNIGQTRSLNKGLALAHGRYIARQDDDDISLPERLEREVALLDSRPEIGLVGTQMQLIDSAGSRLAQPAPFPQANPEIQEELWRNCCFCHGSVMIRRECLPGPDPYEESLKPAEDFDLWLRLAEVTQLANLDAPLYQFRTHASSQSSQKRPVQMYHSAVALERALRRRWGDPFPAQPAAAAARYYLEAAVLAFGSDDQALSAASLASALALAPRLLEADEPLMAILSDYTYSRPVEANVVFCEALFTDLLPRSRRLAQLKSRTISRLHMKAVYRHLRAGRVARPREHLLPSIRRDPSWLLNRGVLAILIRSSLTRPER